jgi:hypothetical protein
MGSAKTALVLPILPISGVPDELVRVLNDRFRSLHLAVAAGAPTTVVKGTPGPPGGQGPPGTPGTGTGPGAPNVLATSTAAVFYAASGNGQVFGFQGRIDLPTTDPNFAAHFARVDVIAIDPSGGSHIVQSFTGDAITGTSIAYSGAVGPQPLANEVWSVAFQCFDELGAPTASPFTITGLAVFPAGVTAVSGAEVAGSHFQDRLQGLHFAVDLTATTAHLQSPVTVTFWLDFSDGNGWTWQGWFRITGGTGTVRIGEPKPGSTSMDGDIWVPPPGRQHWKVAAFPGAYAKTSTLPAGAVTNTFDVTPVGLCTPSDITGAQFLPNPVTNAIITYILHDPGVYNWGYYQLLYTQPTIGVDPWYWFSFVSIQKGHTTNGTCTIVNGTSLTVTTGPALTSADVGKLIYIDQGGERTIVTVSSATQATISLATANGTFLPFEIWNPSPVTATDDEGIDQHPDLYHGRWHAVSASFQGGVTSTPGSAVTYVGAKPPDWTFPLLNNPDGTVNINRKFRCWIWCASHLNDLLPDGTWPPVPFVLQTTCWPNAQDHFDLQPAAQPPALDLTVSNPATISLPLTGGNGLPLTVSSGGITGSYLGPQSVTSTKMAQDAITAANGALAANAVVDSNVHDVSIAKFTAGTNVFSGDVILSRGISLPVLMLQNTGITLFGQSDASAGTAGLLSKPYVQIQPAGIKLYSGYTAPQTKPGSIFLDSASNAMTIYSVDSDTTHPYFTVTTTGLTFVNGVCSVAINSNAINFTDTGNHNALTMNSAGLTVASGSSSPPNNQLVITSSSMQLQLGGQPRVTIDGTTGITISNGGASSVIINANTVAIAQGTLLLNLNGVTTSIANTASAGAAGAGIFVKDNALGIHTVMTPYGLFGMSSSNSVYWAVDMAQTGNARGALGVVDPSNGNTVSLDPDNGVLINGTVVINMTAAFIGPSVASPTIEATTASAQLKVNGQVVCQGNSNNWLGGLQSPGAQVFAGEFGIYGTAVGWPQTASGGSGPGGSGPGLPMGQYATFATGDGRTVYVQGGLIVNVK